MMDRRRFAAMMGSLVLGWPAFAAGDRVALSALYDRRQSVSDTAFSLGGSRVTVTGYMAPPLRARARFFVLTKRPMTHCPFCSDAADWPSDILAVYTKRPVRVVAFNRDIDVSGRLELGEHKDPDTGFVSLVRLTNASYR